MKMIYTTAAVLYNNCVKMILWEGVTMAKKLMCLLLTVMILCLCGCGVDRLDKDDVLKFVGENREMILEDIAQNRFTDTMDMGFVERVEGSANGVIFYCGGYGLSVSSHDFGFYYSYEDVPLTIWIDEEVFKTDALEPDGEGYSADLSGVYYTERIGDGLWYYEFHT